MKMHSRFIAVSALAIAMSAAIPTQAETVVVSRPTREYVYYRDHEIYYRPETKVYYWKDNGTWQSGSVLPTSSRGFVNSGGVTIALDTERPYEQHASVVTKYTSTNRQGDLTTTEKTVHPDGSSSTVSTTTKQRYVYYGDHDIYFSPERKTYYWRADGRWYSGAELPVASRTYVTSGGMEIELDTDRPYDRQDEVVRRYRTRNDAPLSATTQAVQHHADGSKTTTTTTTTKQRYVYYGDHDIYFSPERKTYFWRADGRWYSGAELPLASRTYVTSGGMEIELDTDRPYDRQDEVMRRYRTRNDAPVSNTTQAVAHHADGSKTTTTTTTTTTKQRYVYYRDHDIYFAPERKTYYWRADGRWYSGAELPVASRSYVTSGGVTIELDTDQPYTQHEQVVLRYKNPR